MCTLIYRCYSERGRLTFGEIVIDSNKEVKKRVAKQSSKLRPGKKKKTQLDEYEEDDDDGEDDDIGEEENVSGSFKYFKISDVIKLPIPHIFFNL